ncbi:DMT family transporter [Dactylosporangium sp. AC04546]|uniref:DMT family transporter n=1 Tax=Dactylosporangium sp. AC04546 TaxID=2862460 RepID=UPI001EDCCDA6|nr:DMT family transporter [Dactylosporangium sp. AC04546]WVK83087.1 DMT family transporter [Dactylosporangium sp. AC04546]
MTRRHTVYCVLTCALLGSSFTVSRSIVGYPILTGQALRYALAALALFALLLTSERRLPTAREFVRLGAVAATGLVVFNVLLLVALRHADPAVIGTIVGVSPLVLALLGPLQERRRPSRRLLLAAGVVVLGAGLVEGFGHADPVGLWAALGVLACESAFSLLAAPLLPRLGPVRVSAWSTLLAVPILLLLIPVTGERPRMPTREEATAIAFLGLVLTVVAFVCWYAAVAGLGVDRAGLFVGLVPVFALLTVSIVDGVRPDLPRVAGVLLVGSGLFVAARRVKQESWQAPRSSSAPAASPASPGNSESSSACTTGASTSPAPT